MHSTKNQELWIAVMSSGVALLFSLYICLSLRPGFIFGMIIAHFFFVAPVVFWIRFIRIKYYEKHSVPVNERVDFIERV